MDTVSQEKQIKKTPQISSIRYFGLKFRAANCNKGSSHASYRVRKRFAKPPKARQHDCNLGWSVSRSFSKFVPLRKLSENHYTVGTEISILYQTKHYIAVTTLEIILIFCKCCGQRRLMLKVLKSVLGFHLEWSKYQANNHHLLL